MGPLGSKREHRADELGLVAGGGDTALANASYL